REALVHRGADVDQVPGRAVDADDRDVSALAHGVDRPVDRDRDAGLHEHLAEEALELAALGFHADRFDADVGAAAFELIFQVRDDVRDFLEVDRLDAGVTARELEAVLDGIDGDDPAGAGAPGRLHREEADRAAAEDDDG